MAKTKKKTQKTSIENSFKVKSKSQKGKFKKKKVTKHGETELSNPFLKEKQLQKKVKIYKIVDDSIVEPKNSSIVYSEEDDSFHKVKSSAISEKTSTPLRPKHSLRSPKLHFKNQLSGIKPNFATPISEHVTNVSNILSNVSNIIKEISESNSSFSQMREKQTVNGKNKQNLNTNETNINSTVSLSSHKDDNPDLDKKFVSKMNITLSSINKHDVEKSPSNITNNSHMQYDSFLNEFYLKANPNVVTEKANTDMSWDQHSIHQSLDLSEMIKIDPALAEFLNAPGPMDNKMKYLITKMCSLMEENEVLKKHLDWLNDKYNAQNIELKKLISPTDDNIECKTLGEMKKEYYKLKNHYETIDNHLENSLRQKETYKKAMLLHKSEKETLENNLINLWEIEDDKLRINELLNIQSEIQIDLKNTKDKNLDIKREIKILENENVNLKQELKNSQIICNEHKKEINNLKYEVKNLEHICNRQQNELNALTKNDDPNPEENSKSWYEQVLDEEYYGSSNSEHSQSETNSNCSAHNMTLESISSNDDIDKYTDFYQQENPESEYGEILENHFYNCNFRVRQSLENEHFQATSDPIKVKLRTQKSQIVCKFQVNNVCKNGENCPYLHQYQNQDNSRNLSSNHQTNHYRTSKRASSTNNANNSLIRPNFYPQRFPAQQFSRWLRSQTPRRKSSYLPRSGVKNFPNSPERDLVLNSYENQEREYRSYGRNSWNPDKNETCYYYLRGVCRYGSGCHFYHPTPNANHPNHSHSSQH